MKTFSFFYGSKDVWFNCGEKMSHDYGFYNAVTTVIMQKNGAGMIMATSCFWDKSIDGKFLFSYDKCFTKKLCYNFIF